MKYVTIMGTEWSVFWYEKELPDGSENWGYCHKDKQYIEIVKSMNDRTQELDTFFHELFHAIWHEYKRGETESEEDAVACLSSGLSKIIRDNPDVLKYLNESNEN
jgi:Zn-dependent peptidase ImmA (M78 family)